jgi:DNA-binding Lrp family transcriptional regulator
MPQISHGSCSLRPDLSVVLPDAAADDGGVVTAGRMAMVRAYVLIQAQVGESARVAEAVAKIQGVSFADPVAGPYDLIARAEAADINELAKLVLAKIQAVGGVTRTITCPVVQF